MSLRILFADDSMTAQNMGKKILSEAGYDVVAVSNGAAAVKKIAEHKPDIIILDVYMPGYSGLEVCEKVRGSLDTLKTPVLLTVGKMEPYKPEDANRVKADGVIIKPFEASDLLAIVKKFEERIGSAPPPPLAPKTEPVERYEDEETPAPAAEIRAESRSSSPRVGMQPMVEVPDHMASAAAFGDMLGNEPSSTSHFAVNTPSAAFETSVIVPAPPVPVTDYAVAAPDNREIPIATSEEIPAIAKEEDQAEAVVAEPVQLSPEAVLAEMDAAPEVTVTPVEPESASAPEQYIPEAALEPEPAPQAQHPYFIPVFKEPDPAPEYAFMPTAVPPVSDVDIQREPALQETAEETTRNTPADRVEPGLLSTIGHQIESFEAMPAENSIASPAISPGADTVSDADFEARVAAAMAAYNNTSEMSAARELEVDPQVEVAAEQASAPAATDVYEVSDVETPEAAHNTSAAVPVFEYQPPVRSEAPAAEAVHENTSMQADSPSIESSSTGLEAAMPEAAAAAAANTDADHHTIAQAIHRVMERLKPELLEEIMRELKSKK